MTLIGQILNGTIKYSLESLDIINGGIYDKIKKWLTAMKIWALLSTTF